MITKQDIVAAIKDFSAKQSNPVVARSLKAELYQEDDPTAKQQNVGEVLSYLKSLPANAKTADLYELNTALAFLSNNRDLLAEGDLADLINILHVVEQDAQVPESIARRLCEFKRINLASYDEDDPAETWLNDALVALAESSKALDPQAAGLEAISRIKNLEYLAAPS